MLHHDRELFEDLLLRTSEKLEINAAIVEKDYYVSLLLAKVQEYIPGIIFKGGTSLSKCYHLIDRFSEDIDLGFFEHERPTEGQKRDLKDNVIAAIDALGFKLDNPEEIRSRRDFNRYVIRYPSVFESALINQKLIIETAVFLGIYPTENRLAGNYIYEYLSGERLLDVVDASMIEPFQIKVQNPERTFVDKVFALCDYYLDESYSEHSRHIYDLYKLLEIVPLDEELRKLVKEVRTERSKHKTCLSAKEGIDINNLLEEIIETKVFMSDYNDRTYYLLFRNKISYEQAIESLKIIAESRIFSEM